MLNTAIAHSVTHSNTKFLQKISQCFLFYRKATKIPFFKKIADPQTVDHILTSPIKIRDYDGQFLANGLVFTT